MSEKQARIKKKLFLRLSSLGDVVLATSALEVRSHSRGGEQRDSVDWVVAEEFKVLLEGHPQLHKVWSFDRKTGFKGWKDLGRQLWNEGYDEVYDLHSTLRTKVLKLLFFYWSLMDRRQKFPLWKAICKQRYRLYGYFSFKSFWPNRLRPHSVSSRSAKLVGGLGSEKPDARHLLAGTLQFSPHFEELLSSVRGKTYLCVMPGSKWVGKKWPVENFAELLVRLPVVPVVMGTPSDVESVQLVERLKEKGVPVVSAVGTWSLREVARILAGAWRYLGNDTGLGHLAEAVGVPSFVVFGPTRADMGFGPWRPESRSISRNLACSPCGKDGRFCFRFDQRYACLRGLRAEDVMKEIPEVLAKSKQEIHG